MRGISGLIIPGGESTTIGKLLNDFSLLEPIKEMGEEGLQIFGTCAGLHSSGQEYRRFGTASPGPMDMTVERNISDVR